jgi:putative hemolysin
LELLWNLEFGSWCLIFPFCLFGFLLNLAEVTPIAAFMALLVFAGASFFFALAESSLFSLGKWQVRRLEQEEPHLGKMVSRLLAQPQDLLATIVLGNTFANAAIVGIMLWVTMREDWPMASAMLGLLALILLGGEVAPKTLAVRAPELWALRVARPMFFLQRLSRPLRQIAQTLTNLILRASVPQSVKPPPGTSDAEYQELIELAYQQGTLAAGEKEIILQIISLDRRQAKDVMKPRTQMASIADDLSVEEMIEAARKFKHRRLPIYDETPDTIVGVLNTRVLLLDPNADLADSFVPESMNLLQLLKSLQRQQRGLAIVLDEFGGTAGIITLEDILEEVVGEIRNEGEPQGFVMEKLGQGRWRISGSMRLDDFRREYPQLGEVPGVETMGGLLLNQLEVVPAPGDSVTFHGLKLTVQSADERRVREVLVETLRKK